MSKDTTTDFAAHQLPKVGLAGAGWIGCMRLASLMQSGKATIAAIMDPSREACDRALRMAPGAVGSESFDELLEAGLDGIIIASPSGLHSVQAEAALLTRHAVFCEKPLACTAKDTRKIVEHARQANRLLSIDFAYRFTQALSTIRTLVANGELGHIYSADLTFHNSYGPDKSWFYDRAQSGGGCVIDLGIHLIDAALWMLNYPEVISIRADLFQNGRRLRGAITSQVEDYASVAIRLEGGTALRLTCSWGVPIGKDALIRMLFHGTRGSAEFHNIGGSFYDFRADLYSGRERHPLSLPPDDWGGRALIDWAQRIALNNRFDRNADGFISVAEVIDAIYSGDTESIK